MALYENERCPVCSKPFEKGDDIVTCPECGTPHHRECYKDYGGCKNRALHGTDFVYKKGESKPEESIKTNGFFPPFTDEKKKEESEYYEPEKVTEADEAADPAPEVLGAEKSENEIDGVKAEDIACVVAVNPNKYLPKFIKNKKLNWNWSAFIFGPYYFFFRKMYIPGICFIAVENAVRFIVSAIYASAINAFADIYIKEKDFFAATQVFMGEPEYADYMTAGTIIIVCMLVLHLICALFADNLYRKKCISIVKTVDEKVKMGESFSFMGPAVAMESNLSQKDLRKIFLSRQGGVSTMAPMLAFIAIQLISFI